MKAGKIPESVLKRSVLKEWKQHNDEVLQGPGVGVDFGALEIGENAVVLSVDPVTCAADSARHGVMGALNDVACSGATPMGILVSVLLPTSMNEPQLRELMKEIDAACEEAGVSVLGGHTEVTRLVNAPIITVTGIGACKKDACVLSGKIEAGMDILVTKWIGLQGTAILAKEEEEALRTRFSQPFIDGAKAFDGHLCVCEEARVATTNKVAAMHNVEEGGVFGALWEFAQTSGVGLEIDTKKIPIRQETVEVCEFFDLNPYKLLGGGSLLLAAWDGNHLVRELEKVGILATVIGKATDSNDRVLLQDDERRFLETAQTDELHRVRK